MCSYIQSKVCHKLLFVIDFHMCQTSVQSFRSKMPLTHWCCRTLKSAVWWKRCTVKCCWDSAVTPSYAVRRRCRWRIPTCVLCLMALVGTVNKPISQIPRCTYFISHNAPFRQKCAHFCSEWCIVWYGTGALWDVWTRSVRSQGRISINFRSKLHKIACTCFNKFSIKIAQYH